MSINVVLIFDCVVERTGWREAFLNQRFTPESVEFNYCLSCRAIRVKHHASIYAGRRIGRGCNVPQWIGDRCRTPEWIIISVIGDLIIRVLDGSLHSPVTVPSVNSCQTADSVTARE